MLIKNGGFKTYADKKWGMVDCILFAVMWENKVEDVLTFDAHFEQAGFKLLSKRTTI